MKDFMAFAGFQAVWLSCAFGAAAGLAWPGIVAAAIYAGLQGAASPRPGALALAVLASGAAGLVVENLLALGGFVRFAASWPSEALAPAWIIALWLAFGASLGVTSRLLGERSLSKAVVLGAVGGPLAYYAGERIGALSVSEPALPGYAVMACAWAVAFPALIALWRRLG